MKKTFLLLVPVIMLIGACAPATQSISGVPFDPNLESVRLQLTSDAAQGEAQIYSIMATGTAEAPIIAITQRAADLQYQQEQFSIQSTQIAASWTTTPSPTATITMTSTPDATQTLVFAQSIADVRNIQLETERNERINLLKTYVGYAVLGLLSILGVISAYVFLKRFSFSPVGVDDFGKPLPVINYIDGVLTDLDKAANGTVGITQKFLAQLPTITAERQDRVTERAQMVDVSTRARASRRLQDDRKGQLLLEPQAASQTLSTKFLLPSWEIINGWDGKNGLPYYTANGLETFSVDKVPHLSVTGETGSGKTRRFLRPLIACALAAGYRVVIIGKSKDYSVFKHHPNANLIGISNVLDPDQALRYANILSAVVQEMNRRDELLTSKDKSLWSDAGYVGTIIVCDEIGNSLNIMDKANRAAANQTRAWAEGLVAEGRAVGLHMWFGSQRATGMLGIYSQTRKAIFRVAPDEEAQHRSMSGASNLDDGYYLAKFSASKLAGGFEPSDEQINSFLNSRMVPKVENSADEWIDAIATDVPKSLPITHTTQRLTDNVVVKPAPTKSRGEFVNSLVNEWEVQALELYEAGLEQVHIVEKLFAGDDPVIGAAAVADLIQRWQIVKGAAPANSQPAPVAFEQAMQDPEAEIDAQIRSLHAQGKSNTYIVYKIWDKSSAEFSDRMARVKRVLATASASESRETPENEPVAA